MRQYILSVALLLLSAGSVSAQQIRIELECDSLPLNIAKNISGNPDYQPGVDVDGNPVQPADLNSKTKTSIYPFKIPIELDMVRWLNMDLQGQLNINNDIAYITLHEDGHAEYNGHDLTGNVEYACNHDAAAEAKQETAQEEFQNETSQAKLENKKTGTAKELLEPMSLIVDKPVSNKKIEEQTP